MSWFRKSLSLILRLAGLAVGLALLVLLLVYMSHGFGEKIEPGKAAYERARLGGRPAAIVERLETTELVYATGTVAPRNRTQVASQLLALIREVRVRASDPVERGQLLVVLDDRELQAQLGEAQANLAAMQADLTVRRRDFERYQQLFADNAVSKEDYDRAEGALKVAEAQLLRAQRQVDRIQVMLTYAQITSPVSGVVADRYVDPGDLAAPGKPLLTIHDPRQLELHANIREGLAGLVRTGMKLQVRIDAVGLDAEGVVREIVPQAEATSRSVLVKVSLPSEQTAGLYLGMFGRLAIPVGRSEHLVVPEEAVVRVGQLTLLEVVRDDDSLERRLIRIGRRFDGRVEILSGVREGERVALPAPKDGISAAANHPTHAATHRPLKRVAMNCS